MSRLFLVRHGQASFLTDDYDRLSETGREQSRLLGEWFAAQGISFDYAYTGPRVRQRDTGDIVRETLASKGLAHPECEEIPALDECQTDMHIDRYVPTLRDEYEHLVELEQAFLAAEDFGAKRKTFQHLYDAVMRLYIHEKFRLDGLETWGEFLARVAEAMRYMIENAASGTNVVAYTSGGTIAAANHFVIETPPDPTLEFMWQGRNTGITEYMFSRGRISLVSFNSVPHLQDRALWTHR